MTSTTARKKEIDYYDAISWRDHRIQSGFKLLREYAPLRCSFLEECLLSKRLMGQPKNSLGGCKILDVGCGGGYMTRALVKRGAQVLGLDTSSVTISGNNAALSDEYQPEEVKRVKFVCGEVADLNKKELFDVVIASEVIEHVDHPKLLLSQMHTLLKPGGLMMITAPNRNLISRLVIILGAEKLGKLLKSGTHEYERLVKPREVDEFLCQVKPSDSRCKIRTLSRWFLTWRNGGRMNGNGPLEADRTTNTERDRAAHKYERIGFSGAAVLFSPRLNHILWFREPLGTVTWMAAYRKLAD